MNLSNLELDQSAYDRQQQEQPFATTTTTEAERLNMPPATTVTAVHAAVPPITKGASASIVLDRSSPNTVLANLAGGSNQEAAIVTEAFAPKLPKEPEGTSPMRDEEKVVADAAAFMAISSSSTMTESNGCHRHAATAPSTTTDGNSVDHPTKKPAGLQREHDGTAPSLPPSMNSNINNKPTKKKRTQVLGRTSGHKKLPLRSVPVEQNSNSTATSSKATMENVYHPTTKKTPETVKRDHQKALMKHRLVLPPVGTKIRRRYDVDGEGGVWFDGEIITSSAGCSKAFYPGGEGEIENLPDDEQVILADAAYKLKYAAHGFDYARPGPGGKVRKHYEDEGWFTGDVIYQEEGRTLVRFEDDEEEAMTDEELLVCTVAHKLHHTPEECADLLFLETPSNAQVAVAPSRSEKEAWQKRTAPCKATSPRRTSLSSLDHKRTSKRTQKSTPELMDLGEENSTKATSSDGVARRRTSKRSKRNLLDENREESDGVARRCTSNRSKKNSPNGNVEESSLSANPAKTKTSNSCDSTPRHAIGTSIRKRFRDKGWFNGEITRVGKNAQVRFSDGQAEYMSDGELDVAVGSHKLYVNPPTARPGPGSRVRQRFDIGWFDGSFVSEDSTRKAYILYDDGDDEYMSEEESATAAMAYTNHHSRV